MDFAKQNTERAGFQFDHDPRTPTRFLKEFTTAGWSTGLSPALYGSTPEFLKQMEDGSTYFNISMDAAAPAPIGTTNNTAEASSYMTADPNIAADVSGYRLADPSQNVPRRSDGEYPFVIGNIELNKSMKRSASSNTSGSSELKRPKLLTMESSNSGISTAVQSTVDSAGDTPPETLSDERSYDISAPTPSWNAPVSTKEYAQSAISYANYYPANLQQPPIPTTATLRPSTATLNPAQSFNASLQSYAAQYSTLHYQSLPLPMPVQGHVGAKPTLHDRRISRTASASQQPSPATSVTDLPTPLPALAPIVAPVPAKPAAPRKNAAAKPRAKKAAKRGKAADASPAAEGSAYADMDDEKRAQFLERNRLAACRSRQKKKEWISNMEAAAEDLTARNATLQQTVDELQAELAAMREELAAHNHCTCDAVQQAKSVRSSSAALASAPPALHHSQPVLHHPQPVLHHPQPMNARPSEPNMFSRSAVSEKHKRSSSLADNDLGGPFSATGLNMTMPEREPDIQIPPRPSSAPPSVSPKTEDRFLGGDYFSVNGSASASFATPNLAQCLEF